MENLIERTESSFQPKSMTEKVADTASTTLSTQAWVVKHEIAGNSLSSFRKLDHNQDGALNDLDFNYVEQNHGKFYQSERNTARFLNQNYHAMRDMVMDKCECNENKNEKGISSADLSQFKRVTQTDFSARTAAITDAAGESLLPLGIGALSVGALLFLRNNPSDWLNAFKPVYAFGTFLMGGGLVYRWSQVGDDTLKYENMRKSAGDMTFPSNYESYKNFLK